MTHEDVIIFEELNLKKTPKTDKLEKKFEVLLISDKDINIISFKGRELHSAGV